MEISGDELSRERRALDRANDGALRAQVTLLAAAFEDDGTTAEHKAELLLGGLARRRFLTLGGLSVATAAVLAACGSSSKVVEAVPQAGSAPSTTALPDRVYSDIVLLRTAASLEYNAVAAYDAAIGMLTGAQADIAKAFREHHQGHAMAMDTQTTNLGGQAYGKPNPVVDEKVLQPALLLMKTPTDALQLVHGLENVAAHTYQLLVPILSQPKLRSTVMSIGSIEARHAAVLAKALGSAPFTALAPIPAAGATSTAKPASTTPTLPGGVTAPVFYQVPGSFEPVGATQVQLGTQVVAIQPLGPNSYMY